MPTLALSPVEIQSLNLELENERLIYAAIRYSPHILGSPFKVGEAPTYKIVDDSINAEESITKAEHVQKALSRLDELAKD